MKKTFGIILAVFFVSVNLFAGGGGQAAAGAAAGKRTLVFTLWDNLADLKMDAIIAEFERLNPDITVETRITPQARYEEVMRPILQSGDAPDVMQVNDGTLALYGERNFLHPLDDLAKNHIDVNRFYENPLRMGRYNGQLVGFPIGASVILLVYNRDMFKAAGLPDPSAKWADPSWNLETIVEYAKKLTIRQGNMVTQWGLAGFGGVTGTVSEVLLPGAYTGKAMFGDTGYDNLVCSPEARPGLKWVWDIIHTHKVHPPIGDSSQAQNMFISGQAAILLDRSGTFGMFRDQITFDWDIAPIMTGKYATTAGGIRIYAIPRQAKDKDFSAKFLFFLGQEYAQHQMALAGYVPVDKEYAAKYYIQPNLKPSRQQVAVDGLNYWQNLVNLPLNIEAKTPFRQYFIQALGGEMDMDEAIDKAKVEVDAILARGQN